MNFFYSNRRHGGFIVQTDLPFAEAKAKRSHIKKPLNAFMIFMKEMRQSVIDECTLKESAAINQILGRRVSRRGFQLVINILFFRVRDSILCGFMV